MNVLVTGGDGFIGKWLIQTLGDRFSWRVAGRKNNLAQLTFDSRTVPYLRTDYSISSIRHLLSSVDAVVHLACKRHEPRALMDQYVSNIALASNLYEACATSNVRNIVHVSSIGVYDSETPLPWVESQDSFPESFYGISKLTVEKLGGWYNKKRGLRIKDLRVAQVMGVGERKGFMLSVFLEKAAKQEKLQLWGKGEGARDYIYVKDVALAIGQALQHADQSGVFNVGSGTRVKHRELAEAINETFDNAGNLETLEDRPEDLSIHQMDIERTRRILGWQPTWSLQDALLDIKMLLDSE